MSNDFTIDVEHEGRAAYVAVEVLETAAGAVLVDTGPGSTLATLQRGLAARGLRSGDLHAVLLSHIHLDHAGAAGLLAAANPGLTVYVHRRGAPHLVDPAKLLASATRIYGDRMDTLWGPFLPIPAERVVALDGGESLVVGGRRFDVLYTPGHASHHVSYHEPATGTVYVGDTGGMRLASVPRALPVTPPPDFHLERWLASIDLIENRRPARLFRTHFGFDDEPATSLEELRRGLIDWAVATRALLSADITTAERRDRFHDAAVAWLRDDAPAATAEAYGAFADFRSSFDGIARYWATHAAH